MDRIEALEEAIQKESLVGIYSVFYTIVHGDPNFSTGKFMETLEYVKRKNIKNFMQEFDGDEFEPEDKWDQEYWAFIASSLMDNFCEIRIQHLKKVGQKVYPVRNNAHSSTAASPKASGNGRNGTTEYVQKRVPHITEEQKQNTRMKNQQRREGRGFFGSLFSRH